MNDFEDLVDWFLANDIEGKVSQRTINSTQLFDPSIRKLEYTTNHAEPLVDGWHRISSSQIFYYSVNGLPHSLNDCPARVYFDLIASAVFVFFEKGVTHRASGPAIVEKANHYWYWKGERLTLDNWLRVCELTEDEKVLLKMQYG